MVFLMLDDIYSKDRPKVPWMHTQSLVVALEADLLRKQSSEPPKPS